MPKQQDSQQIVPRRSFLFAPGTAPHMFPKAIAAKPDIMCVDLEDAIAPQHKVESRQQTFAWFNEYLAGETETEVELLVRINSLRSADGMADVLMLLEQRNYPVIISEVQASSSHTSKTRYTPRVTKHHMKQIVRLKSRHQPLTDNTTKAETSAAYRQHD